MSSSDRPAAPPIAGQLEAAAAALAQAVAAGDVASIPDRPLQELFAAVVRAYTAKLEAEVTLSPFPPGHQVTATDVMRAVTEILDAVQVELFELGMWQAWTRPRRGG